MDNRGKADIECVAAAGVALVVLNYDGKEKLLACLERAFAVRYRPLHVVVVDNGSTDGSAEAVRSRYPDVHVVRIDDNAGVAGGRNAGVRWVEERLDVAYLVFLDNDARIETETVGELVAAADRDERIGLVTPKAFRREGSRTLLSAGGMHFNRFTGVIRDVASGEIDDGRYEETRDVQACPGFASLVRRSVFRRIGLFDETFNPYGWEDVDFSLRASRAGFRIVYAPKAVVHHAGGRVGRGLLDSYERSKARNYFRFVRRHTTTFEWICFLAALPMRALARAIQEVASGNGRVVRLWLGALRRDG